MERADSGCFGSEEAVKTIYKSNKGVVLPFPGGICRAGSKAGSLKYNLPASTNHLLCPKLRNNLADSGVPEGVNSVYEIVINGLNFEAVKTAMVNGVKGATRVPGVIQISAANFGGKLGPYKAHLKEALEN